MVIIARCVHSIINASVSVTTKNEKLRFNFSITIFNHLHHNFKLFGVKYRNDCVKHES